MTEVVWRHMGTRQILGIGTNWNPQVRSRIRDERPPVRAAQAVDSV